MLFVISTWNCQNPPAKQVSPITGPLIIACLEVHVVERIVNHFPPHDLLVNRKQIALYMQI
jgi:hypothetical protein